MDHVATPHQALRSLRSIILAGLASAALGLALAACGDDAPDPEASTALETEAVAAESVDTDTASDVGGDGGTQTLAVDTAGPAAGDDASGEVTSGEGEGQPSDSGGEDASGEGKDQDGTGAPGTDSSGFPEPDAETDYSPSGGGHDVASGVGGGTEEREDLDYPAGSVVDLSTGSTIDLATNLTGRDRITLLWFWMPDCPACDPEAPVVADFAKTYQGQIDVVGVGAGASRAEAEDFAAEHDLGPATMVWDPSGASHTHYNVTVTPFAIMVDPGGSVMAQWRGMTPELFAFAERVS